MEISELKLPDEFEMGNNVAEYIKNLQKILGTRKLNISFGVEIEGDEINREFEIIVYWEHPRVEYADDKNLAEKINLKNEQTMKEFASRLEKKRWSIDCAKEINIPMEYQYKIFKLKATKKRI